MRGVAQKIADAGARLVLIGNGSPEGAEELVSRPDDPWEVVLDPKLLGYRAAELERSVLAAFRPGALTRMWRALRAGFRQGATDGDAFQLGGVFLIAPPGVVRHSHVHRTPYETMPLREILDSLAEMRRTPDPP